MELTEKQKEAFERLMSIPAFEYDLSEDLSPDILMRLILEYARILDAIINLLESPEISEETRQCLKKDFYLLEKKIDIICSKMHEKTAGTGL